MTHATGTHPYRKTQILTASPSELMLLLYNAAICFCEQAKRKTEEKKYDDTHTLLVKAENIVMELSSGLRSDVYPELVDNLRRLLEFVFYRLFEANVSRNPRCIDEAVDVLTALRDAWVDGVDKAAKEAQPVGTTQPVGSVELSA